MVYAPVVIPTLNRAEHLKRCLESLGRNTGADQTEVFVSVDYPPAEKYVEGYNRLKEMLQAMDFSCFKKIHIFYQEKNLGSIKNSAFLYEKVVESFDRYIFTEDDNEFAPNFLEYINQGLTMFQEDPKVVAICGARDTQWETDHKPVTFTKLYAAYGVGKWVEKGNQIDDRLSAVLLPEKIYGPGIMWRLLRRNRCLFNGYVLGIVCSDRGFFWRGEHDLRRCDSVYSMYMHLTDGVCIAPEVAKSRTWGNDGSGENMQKLDIDPEKEWPLDQNHSFSYPDPETLCFIEENYRLGNAYMSQGQWMNTAKAVLAYCAVLLCGRDRGRVIQMVKAVKKLLGKR